MPRNAATGSPDADVQRLHQQWLDRLQKLVVCVDQWAQEFGWSTRRIPKRMEDSQVGTYEAPALLLQEATTRILLEPIARSVPGAEGVVDLYLMPAYDDIASLYFADGEWRLHYMFPGSPTVNTIKDAESLPLSKEALRSVLNEMTAHAATV